MPERKTFCRLCLTHCGMIVSVNDQEQIVDIRPDRDDPLTQGFACYKGLQAPEAHRAAHRVLHPLKRTADGKFERIGLELALDEIAAGLREIIEHHGEEAVGGYKGSGAGLNAAACFLLDDFLRVMGSHKLFSATTIDQSAKIVAADRLGSWPPGPHPLAGSDVLMLIGSNPLVSLSASLDPHRALQRLKAEIARGMKLLIVDPRRTETARFAHVHLQPLPGEDATIIAGMLRLILEREWHDKDFVARHVAQLDELRAAVEPFTPEYVAQRADVPVEQFIRLIETFATASRGRVKTGTGGNMGPHSNLVEHLAQCLNVLCGRFVREGERIGNPGVLLARRPRRCQVAPAKRSWERGYRSRLGDYGQLLGELPTGIMADEILQPGDGRIRGFIVHGGNPAVIVPDQLKTVRALRSLELLVTIDPFMTPTAKLSHYVLPTLLQYERPDFPCWQAEHLYYERPYTRYTNAVAQPPADSEVTSDEYIYWSLAKRLGLTLTFLGSPLNMERPPKTDELLEIVARNAPVSFEEIKRHELGGIFEGEPQYAEPGDPGPEDRFTVAPLDVVEEIRQLAAEDFRREVVVGDGVRAAHRLIVRRHRHLWNSIGRELEGIKRRLPYNTAKLHPQDLAALGLSPGETARITSEAGALEIIVEADETLRPGVVSVTHGFGLLPGETDHRRDGACVNLLISTDRELQTINAMPRMTGFAVHIAPVSDFAGA